MTLPLVIAAVTVLAMGALLGVAIDRLYLTRRLKNAPFHMHFTFKGFQQSQLEALMAIIHHEITRHGLSINHRSVQSIAPQKTGDEGADASA